MFVFYLYGRLYEGTLLYKRFGKEDGIKVVNKNDGHRELAVVSITRFTSHEVE